MQKIIDDVAVFLVLVASVAGGDDVALGGMSTAAEGNGMIHCHLIGEQGYVAVETVCRAALLCPPACAAQLLGFGFLALDVCL